MDYGCSSRTGYPVNHMTSCYWTDVLCINLRVAFKGKCLIHTGSWARVVTLDSDMYPYWHIGLIAMRAP